MNKKLLWLFIDRRTGEGRSGLYMADLRANLSDKLEYGEERTKAFIPSWQCVLLLLKLGGPVGYLCV